MTESTVRTSSTTTFETMNTTFLLTLALTATTAFAQTHTIPAVAASAPGNGSAPNYPWGTSGTGIRELAVYDSSNFSGLAAPILITALRWRADETSNSWTGGQFGQVTVRLSTAAVDYASMSTSWNANHGADVLTVHSGAVTVSPGAFSPSGVGVTLVDLRLQRPFLYDPSQGDLAIEVDHLNGDNYVGGSVAACDYVPLGPASELISTANYPNPALTINRAPVVELAYTPAGGLLAYFRESASTGTSPLTVAFTDGSYSSAPGGIQTWEWDFDDDGVVDGTQQNPTHTYTACGDFDVRLRVTDGVNPPSTTVVPALVRLDEFTPYFSYTQLTPPNIQFTDTSNPPATAWAWDFDGDGRTDSVVQNPVWSAPNQCAVANVSLTAVHRCRIATTTRRVFAAPNPAVIGTLQGGLVTVGGNLFDLTVTANDGIRICGLRTLSASPSTGQIAVEVYITDGTHVGKEGTAAAWRKVATGSGTKTTPGNQFLDVSVTPFHLPPGDYGMAIYNRFARSGGGASVRSTHPSLAATPYVRADFVLHPNGQGSASTGPFTGNGATQRLWNGGFYYTKCSNTSESAYGVFATGCAGTMGVSALTTETPPRLGGAMRITVDNLPEGIAVMVVGLNNTSSQFGALPLDLTSRGAPGCHLRVHDYAARLLTSNGNEASWSWTIPNDPALLCQPVYNQALVLDFAANALGAVMSDAAGGVLGY